TSAPLFDPYSSSTECQRLGANLDPLRLPTPSRDRRRAAALVLDRTRGLPVPFEDVAPGGDAELRRRKGHRPRHEGSLLVRLGGLPAFLVHPPMDSPSLLRERVVRPFALHELDVEQSRTEDELVDHSDRYQIWNGASHGGPPGQAAIGKSKLCSRPAGDRKSTRLNSSH